jgi:hypothetical protein
LQSDYSNITIFIIKELDVPAMVKELFVKLLNRMIDLPMMVRQLEGVRNRGPWMGFKMDSLHACLYYRAKEIK